MIGSIDVEYFGTCASLSSSTESGAFLALGSPVTPDCASSSTYEERLNKPIPADWHQVRQQLENQAALICPVEGCGKVFAAAPGLREHQRLHLGDAPYACPVPGCGRSFKWRSSAAMHKKSHAFQASNGRRGRRKTARSTHKTPKASETVVEAKSRPELNVTYVEPMSPDSTQSLFEGVNDDFSLPVYKQQEPTFVQQDCLFESFDILDASALPLDSLMTDYFLFE
mmetsp:Transcript_3288/g.10061  ORF Transcript_3288/g.10061 Transcript_3288/m.10061 type:complete len:226 (+) Transcript_3288:190-867(+)